MTWDPRTDAELLRLRDEEHLDFAQIGRKISKTRGAAVGRYYRLIGHMFPSDRRRRYHGSRPEASRAHHEMGGVSAAKYPFAPDCSCPDFAWDDDHCGAVLAAGGFPILERRAA